MPALCGWSSGTRHVDNPVTSLDTTPTLVYLSLKLKGHIDSFFITGCTAGHDNLRCSQWWKGHQHDNLSISVFGHIVVPFITHSKYTLHASVQCLSLCNWTTGILWFNLNMKIAGLSLTRVRPAWMVSHTRARLGLVRPLGWDLRYKSNVECRFMKINGQNDIEGQGQWPSFSMPTKSISRCMFGANLVTLAQICDESSHRQIKFPTILSQNCQNDLESQGQWPSFSIPAESIPRWIFGVYLVSIAQTCDELSRRKATFPRILSQNDLEGQCQWPPFSITAESIPRCMFGAHLVILAQICDELSCGQGKVFGQTDRRTDGQKYGQTQATTITVWQVSINHWASCRIDENEI